MKSFSTIIVLFFVLAGCGQHSEGAKTTPPKNPESKKALDSIAKGTCTKVRTYDEIKRGVPCKKD